MKIFQLKKPLLLCSMVVIGGVVRAAAVDDAVTELQHEWEVIKYQMPLKQQEEKFAGLAAKAAKTVEAFPQRAEPLIWKGIIVSSWAGAKGGLGALSLVKEAKADYETAIKLNADALEGSAMNSLGVLYYKVPGWPVGFGNKDKAKEWLQKALAVQPKGMDPNFFYGEYLLEQGNATESITYLERALQAAPRPGRAIADAGRREEIKVLLEKARASAK